MKFNSVVMIQEPSKAILVRLPDGAEAECNGLREILQWFEANVIHHLTTEDDPIYVHRVIKLNDARPHEILLERLNTQDVAEFKLKFMHLDSGEIADESAFIQSKLELDEGYKLAKINLTTVL